MEVNLELSRKLLFVGAAVFVVVAIILLLGVIQPVKAEFSRGETTQKAITAFCYNIGFHFLMAIIIILIAFMSAGLSKTSLIFLVILGIIALLLGIIFLDAGSAYYSHGASMRAASVLLFVCAALDILNGIFIIILANIRPRIKRI